MHIWREGSIQLECRFPLIQRGRWKAYAIFPLILCFLGSLYGKGGNEKKTELFVNHISDQKGLSDGQYNDFIYTDSRGFTWISSISGINRFDGNHVKQYRSNFKGSNGLIDENVQSNFFEDRQGNLWFSTYEGLICYQRKTDRFQAFQFSFQDTLIPNTYHVFYMDSLKQSLWLLVGRRIFEFDIAKEEYIFTGIQSEGFRFAVIPDKEGGVKELLTYFLSGDVGFEHWKRKDEKWMSQKFLDGSGEEGLQAKVYKIYVERANKLWICSDKGLILKEKGKLQIFKPEEESQFTCYSICPFSDTHFLISSLSKGIFMFNTSTHEFSQDNPNLKSTSQLGKITRQLYKDKGEMFWIVQRPNGVKYAIQSTANFYNPLEAYPMRTEAVTHILEDNNKNTWIASRGKGISVLNPSGSLIQRFPLWLLFKIDGRGAEIRHLSKDREGNIWWISSGGISKYDITKNQWEHILDSKLKLFFSYHSPSGKVLLATGNGLFELVEGPEGYFLEAIPDFSGSVRFDFARMIVTSDQDIFISKFNGDLEIYREDSLGKLILKRRISLGLEAKSFFEDEEEKRLWMATSFGPISIDLRTLAVDILFEEEWDYSRGTIRFVMQDYNARVWIATNKGLWSCDQEGKDLKRFNEVDGLASVDFSPQAFLRKEEGEIWLGHSEGLSVFDPNNLSVYPFAPKPYIDKLFTNKGEFLQETQIGESERIKLPFDENSLRFQLLANGYFHPTLSKVKYRLLNYDTTWTSIKSGEYAQFRKLAPGNYTLEYVALGANLQQSHSKRLEITIDPPFWQTWWFRTLGLLFFASLIALSVRMYVAKKLRIQKIFFERQQAKHEERNRISGELHDDLGNSLSNILFLSRSILMGERNEERRKKLQKISDSAATLFDQAKDIVWALNVENDSLEKLLIVLRSDISKFLDTNQMDYRLDLPETVPEIELNGEDRRNLLLIAKESIRNIVRHAQASQALLALRIEEDQLVLEIADDGIGLPESHQEHRGNGLRNIQKRADSLGAKLEIQTGKDKGTSIRLKVGLDKLQS